VRTAELTGTYLKPVVRLRFSLRERTLRGKNMALVDWVKALPGRFWNADERCWDVTGLGATPTKTLEDQGFEIDLETLADDPTLDDVECLEELVDPVLRRFSRRPHVVLVRPRLAGFQLAKERLGAGAMWDKKTGRFEMPLGDVLDHDGNTRGGLIMDSDLPSAAAQLRIRPERVQGLMKLAAHPSFDEDNPAIEHIGDVPEWFGLDLFPFQRSGAVATAGGQALIADQPGLGKTRQGLAAAAIRRTKRLLVISPPVALTHWQRESATSRVTTGGKKDRADAVVVLPGRKQPEFPERGIVVVSDSLLSNRPGLAKDICDWSPDGLIVDEAHRAKTWESKRSAAVRDVAARVGEGLRVAITGTPMFANPIEMLPLLFITGHLDPVFGGFDQFATTYCYQDHFGRWRPRKGEIARLRKMLDRWVWVRREKDDVLDLPEKTRYDLITDIDLADYRKAHREVEERVAEWVDEFYEDTGKLPRDKHVEDYAMNSIHLVSLLRVAAGLSKVAPAVEYIQEWVTSSGSHKDEQGRTIFNRPLVVWTHHRAVSKAMAAAVPEAVGRARVIMGGIDEKEKAQIVDDFQEGLIPVVVASITAAGTGITLTRSSDALFVETDWTPALVQQAEDRVHRIGSSKPVSITTMVSPGTLDEQVQKVLANKGEVLTSLMGSDQDVSVVEFEDDESVAPSAIVAEIAERVIRSRKRTSRRKAA